MPRKKLRKPNRPKALPPRGFRDNFGAEVTARRDMIAKISDIYHCYGFEALESSAIESLDALGKFLPDIDSPNEGVFAWRDEEKHWLALRYDLTAPLARVYAQHRNKLPLPYRRYAVGTVWRNEKPGPGRYRQFYQCDADTIGSTSIAADAELCAMLADSLESVGIKKGDYIIRLNNRKILNGILDNIGLSLAEGSTRDAVLRTIDKFDKVGVDGVRALLTSGRRDKSGAFISGLDLSHGQAEQIIAFLTAKTGKDSNDIETLRYLSKKSTTAQQGIDELIAITDLLAVGGYNNDRISIDSSIVRGLSYYTGAVFEAELTFEIYDNKGCKRQFGSVAGGGRYDNLIKRFTNQKIAATGVSIGVDRLLAALYESGKMWLTKSGPIVVTVMDKGRIGDYQAMVRVLRNAGIRAELYLGNPKNFSAQLKYADKRNSAAVVIQGENELRNNVVQIKDLALGSKLSATIKSSQEWKAHPAQITVNNEELVTAIHTILHRNNKVNFNG